MNQRCDLTLLGELYHSKKQGGIATAAMKLATKKPVQNNQATIASRQRAALPFMGRAVALNTTASLKYSVKLRQKTAVSLV